MFLVAYAGLLEATGERLCNCLRENSVKVLMDCLSFFSLQGGGGDN